MSLDKAALLDKARNCLDQEIAAIKATAEHLDDSFVATIETIQETILDGKKLIFTGVGKNVAIGEKLAGTFNSTGVPACFLDPSQALHGNLGVCTEGDLALLISNSGQTEELIQMLPLIKRLGLKTILITSKADSDLAANSDLVLLYRVDEEACPLNLAPTASTTAAMALGDALAMVYLDVRGFTREDFAKLHPAGSLGKSLLLLVSEIMRTGERFASLPETSTVQDCIMSMTKVKCGTLALTNTGTGKLIGVFTDGDLRRAAVKGDDFLHKPVTEYMTRDPKVISDNALAVDALRILEKSLIDDLVVVDDNLCPIGIIDGQDLPKLKIV